MTIRAFLILCSILSSLTINLVPRAAAAATPVAQCSQPTSTRAGCFAQVLSANPAGGPAGYTPANFRSAYGAAGSGSAKIAIVDAYGDPTIKADLDNYSRVFRLPVMPACTSQSQTGCFEKTDQSGGRHYPSTNKGWAVETALDVEAAHAVCPGCRIELVQATTASTANLIAAVDQAVRSGAQIVSMSWGGSETASEISSDAHFPTNVDFVASSGDSGYGTSWPAASPRVVAVGGTRLALAPGGARAGETAWAGSGSGCSKYEAKPSWQHDAGCARRTMADVSADADPATGAAIYTGTSPNGAGWFTVGGTSLAAPLVAGLIGLAGPVSQTTLFSRLYGSLGTSRLHDITSGVTGSCSSYLCRAGAGYDGPTGAGTLAGLGAL